MRKKIQDIYLRDWIFPSLNMLKYLPKCCICSLRSFPQTNRHYTYIIWKEKKRIKNGPEISNSSFPLFSNAGSNGWCGSQWSWKWFQQPWSVLWERAAQQQVGGKGPVAGPGLLRPCWVLLMSSQGIWLQAAVWLRAGHRRTGKRPGVCVGGCKVWHGAERALGAQ